MQSSVEVLRTGRDRIAQAWTKDTLTSHWDAKGSDVTGTVIAVCALGALVPEPLIALLRDHDIDYAEQWVTSPNFEMEAVTATLFSHGLMAAEEEWSYGCGTECRATEYLANAIREIDPEYARDCEVRTHQHWDAQRQRVLNTVVKSPEFIADHERDIFLTSEKPHQWFLDHPIITSYNDEIDRTQGEMLRVFDRAIELAAADEAARVVARDGTEVTISEMELATAGD